MRATPPELGARPSAGAGLGTVELVRLLRDAVERCRFCRPGCRCAACAVVLARLSPAARPPRLPAPVAPRMTR